MISDKEKYLSLRTKKRDGSYVNTPVWFSFNEETNSFFIFSAGQAGKVKRIRNFSNVRIASCDVRGSNLGKWASASAQLVSGKDIEELGYSGFGHKYGYQWKLINFFSKLSGKFDKRQLIKITLNS
ncbi:MAG: PPOX class F420-dependent oxidoreductase [SAR86 cluster bacterium]|jgi:uncharacterized protein|nr:PPOX class F420-dependent oxidoreductase [SAR86 cluster bacterium]|tara:strand:- start:706 stop:1083 length:378 start_codon:yes stop_codon:yes gene_type:complete